MSPRGQYWVPFYLLCTLSSSQTSFKKTTLVWSSWICRWHRITESCTSIWFQLGLQRNHSMCCWYESLDEQNQLKRNDENTELLVTGDRIHISLVRKEPLTFGSSAVLFQTSAKYLGVHLDETLSMNEQISSLCRSSYFHLRKIGSIRRYLSDANTAKLVSSLILSRLDHCTSTLSGLPSSLKRLQKVQNKSARLVLSKRKSDHVTPLLKQLHWLPTEALIHYKIATLVFRRFENSLALSELLQICQPTRTLRSSNEKLLKVPKTNLKSAGNRSFHYQSAVVWNSLPIAVRNSL